MKKFTVALALVMTCLSTRAQKLTNIGLHAGYNHNTASGTAISSDYRTSLSGLHVGVDFYAPLSKQFGVRTLLQYEQNGWAYEGLVTENLPGYVTPAQIDIKMNYISLYTMPEISFGKKIAFSLNAGPYLGFLVDNYIRSEFPDSSGWNQTIVTKSTSKDRSSINFGIAAGAGVQTNLSKKMAIRLDARNNFGLTNVLKSSSSKAKLQTFAVSLGVAYQFKRSPL